jgi:hypothetical protein
MVPPQVDIRSNLVVSNPPKATKIFLGESVENLNYAHTFLLKKGKAKRDIKTGAIAATPPALSGILQRMAWIGRKYHSGTI